MHIGVLSGCVGCAVVTVTTFCKWERVGASGSAVVAGWLQGGMVLWFMFQAMVDLCCFLCATLVLLAGTACMEFL